MARVTFDQLLHVYRKVNFNASSAEGKLVIDDYSVLETLKLIASDDVAYDESAVRIISDAADLVLGATISIEIGQPRTGLGLVYKNFDELLSSPVNRIKEPQKYYIIDCNFGYNDNNIPSIITQYRAILKLIQAISEIAAFVDEYKGEAIFISSAKVCVPVVYSTSELSSISQNTISDVETFILDKIHKEQKSEIFSKILIEICKDQPAEVRFRNIVNRMPEIVRKAHDGYRIFASEFSYEKIRGKAEEAISEYNNRIHKTFHDIQNQVLGVPVATVIVSTQLKAVKNCDIDFATNISIAVGATLYVFLISIALYNQVMTLISIGSDLRRQKDKLTKDYASVADNFIEIYTKLESRVLIHKIFMYGIGSICAVGAALTWTVWFYLTTPTTGACLRALAG